MKNLEQIRARNALAWREKIGTGKNDGRAIAKKVPTMIRENGLLAALAFACEQGDGSGHYNVFEAIIAHLSCQEVAKLKQGCTPDQLAEFLAASETVSATRLRDITSETMAFLNYLRRFAGK